MNHSPIRVVGLSDEDAATLNTLRAQLSQKTPRNVMRAARYDARHALRHVSPVVPPIYRSLGFVLGWPAKAVDLLARRCNLEGFSWPGGDLESLGYSEVWDQNALSAATDQAITSSLLHATAFVVVTRGGAGEPPALIHFRSALSATGAWDARSRRLTALLSIIARDDDGEATECVLYLPGVTTTIRRDTPRQWSVTDRQAHPYGVPAFALPYRPRLDRPFGSSRLSRPAMAINDEAIRSVLRGMGHMDTYSFPELWMLGADEGIFTSSDGSRKSPWQIMLGRIKAIPDDEDATNPRADVKHIPGSDPTPHLAWLNGMSKLFARELSLPDSAVAITDFANPTSADAYDASQNELIAEAEGACDEWSAPLSQAMATALAIANGLDGVPREWAGLKPQWRDPRYVSRAAQADAGTKQIAAVPWLGQTEVGLELLGLTVDQRDRALGEQRRAEGRGILAQLAQARTTDDAVTGEPDDATSG